MSARGVDTLVRGGRVVTATDVVDTAVAIKDGAIVALGPEALLPPAARVIDASGKIVLPGLIDCHLHVGPEYDDWRTAPLAAARTGLTTLLPFVVYDGGETLPAAIARLREEAEAASVLDFGFHFILNHEPRILDGLAEAVALGVTSFKLFMTYKKRPGRMVSDEFIARTMERLAPLGAICQLHCENGDILCYLEDKAIAEGRTAPTDFPGTCPDWTEEEAINRAILIARLTGCPMYVVHLSTRLGLERILRAQQEGQRVWTETCPQYLLLTDREMERWGPFAKIGPPLIGAHANHDGRKPRQIAPGQILRRDHLDARAELLDRGGHGIADAHDVADREAGCCPNVDHFDGRIRRPLLRRSRGEYKLPDTVE